MPHVGQRMSQRSTAITGRRSALAPQCGQDTGLGLSSIDATTGALPQCSRCVSTGRQKQDGLGLDHRSLETIRLMAVERARDGERPSSVMASYGFNRTTIYRWLNVAATPGVGLRALRSRPATGRPRSLTPHQEQQVFRWIDA